MKKYNPWENTKTFIQETGSLPNFIDFLERNNITNTNNDTNNTNIINQEEKKSDENPENNSSCEEIKLFESLNSISKLYYEKLILLEDTYERYRFEYIISKEKQDDILEKLNDIFETLKKIDINKIKITNTLHNMQLSENTTIKIKNSHKNDFRRLLKIIIVHLKYGSEIDFLQKSFLLHPQTLEKIKNKFEEVINMSKKLQSQFNNIENIII